MKRTTKPTVPKVFLEDQHRDVSATNDRYNWKIVAEKGMGSDSSKRGCDERSPSQTVRPLKQPRIVEKGVIDGDSSDNCNVNELVGFSKAFETVVQAHYSDGVRPVDPIMSANPTVFEELREAQRHSKERRVSETARKNMLNNSHVLPNLYDPARNELEYFLKQIATKGVVRLYDAVVEYRRVNLIGATQGQIRKSRRHIPGHLRRSKGR